MLQKTPFYKAHPEMFPRVATWAKHLTETDLNKHPATNGALRIILENPPPTANKEFVLDGRPVLAALLDFDADNGTFHMKSPLRNGARDDAPVNNVPEDEEDSDTGAENETMYLSKKIASSSPKWRTNTRLCDREKTTKSRKSKKGTRR